VFVALNTIQGANRSAQTQVASDALMHSQRIGKAAPNAVQGSVEGFRQLEESRKELNKDINLMTRGGQYQGRSIGEPSADIAVVVAAARKQWTATDLAAGTILTLKADLSGMDKTLQTLHEMSPDLLVRTEDIINLKVQRGASAREIAALGKLTMLTQRMSRSAGEFLTRRHQLRNRVPAGARHHGVPQYARRLPQRQPAARLAAVRERTCAPSSPSCKARSRSTRSW
jgi:twitching motility protein PilJ